jgi:hypothetical protein
MIVFAWKNFHVLFMRMNPAVGWPVKRPGRVDRVVYIFVCMVSVSRRSGAYVIIKRSRALALGPGWILTYCHHAYVIRKRDRACHVPVRRANLVTVEMHARRPAANRHVTCGIRRLPLRIHSDRPSRFQFRSPRKLFDSTGIITETPFHFFSRKPPLPFYKTPN